LILLSSLLLSLLLFSLTFFSFKLALEAMGFPFLLSALGSGAFFLGTLVC
jgi:hypothetical protein